MNNKGKNTKLSQPLQAPRRNPTRTVVFKGRYQVDSGKGGFKRNSKAFDDPEDSFKVLTQSLKIRKQEFLIDARKNYKRKTMGDKITTDMRKRAKLLDAHEQTSESQRMLNHPAQSLQTLGVERNHINANGQVATQTTAFLSAMLAFPQKDQPKVKTQYQQFAEDHGLPKKKAKQLVSDLVSTASLIETQGNNTGKQRMAETFLVKHTTEIADQSENLRFGRSQHKPKPDLKIDIPDRPNLGSNQDVGSHWDGNRTPGGSLTPRSNAIFKTIHSAEQQGIFPNGMADASTTRPIRKSDNTAFGSLQQIGK